MIKAAVHSQTSHSKIKVYFLTIALLIVCILMSFYTQAEGLKPSRVNQSIELKQAPMSFPSKSEIIKKRAEYDKDKINKLSRSKAVSVIETRNSDTVYKEIDYFKDGSIIIPFTGFGYAGDGTRVGNSSLTWFYRKKSAAWTEFGSGEKVKLSISPDSSSYVKNKIYNVDIRLVTKDKNSMTGIDTIKISILAIAK